MKIVYNNDVLKQRVTPYLENAVNHLNNAIRGLNDVSIPYGYPYAGYIRELNISKYKNNIANLKDRVIQSNVQLTQTLSDMKSQISNMDHVQIKLRTNLIRKR